MQAQPSVAVYLAAADGCNGVACPGLEGVFGLVLGHRFSVPRMFKGPGNEPDGQIRLGRRTEPAEERAGVAEADYEALRTRNSRSRPTREAGPLTFSLTRFPS